MAGRRPLNVVHRMLVSHTKKFIYLKTRKTAGTSTEMALQQYCVPPGVFLCEGTDGMDTDFGVVGARGANASEQPWRNHMSASKIRKKLPRAVWNGYTKICNIRNPWDKTVSLFHMKHPEIKEESPGTIIAAFRQWMVEAEHIGKDTPIYFIGQVPVADAYIRYEHLQDDYAALCRKLRLEVNDLPRAKTNQRDGVKIPYQDYFDDPSRDRVGHVFAMEIDHFGWRFDGSQGPQRTMATSGSWTGVWRSLSRRLRGPRAA